jgi:hypothetical protein
LPLFKCGRLFSGGAAQSVVYEHNDRGRPTVGDIDGQGLQGIATRGDNWNCLITADDPRRSAATQLFLKV